MRIHNRCLNIQIQFTLILILALMVCTIVVGCNSKKQDTSAPLVVNVGETQPVTVKRFQTMDVELAQEEVPFKLVLPTYLPVNLEQQAHFHIDYPEIEQSGLSESNQSVDVGVTYYPNDSDYLPHAIWIDYSVCANPLGSCGPTLSEIHTMCVKKNVEGLDVCQCETFMNLKTGPERIAQVSGSTFSWGQNDGCISLCVMGYSDDVAIQVMESMMKD